MEVEVGFFGMYCQGALGWDSNDNACRYRVTKGKQGRTGGRYTGQTEQIPLDHGAKSCRDLWRCQEVLLELSLSAGTYATPLGQPPPAFPFPAHLRSGPGCSARESPHQRADSREQPYYFSVDNEVSAAE